MSSSKDDSCEQAKSAQRIIQQQQMMHEHNLEIENSYREIERNSKKNAGMPSLNSANNLKNAMIMHEILSQPVCKRRKKR